MVTAHHHSSEIKKTPPEKTNEAASITAPDEQPYEPEEEEHDLRTLLSWHAPGRPFRHRSKEYFINATLIMLALQIILFLFAQYLLMLVVFSLVFLAFALAIVPPHMFYYKITTQGIRVEDHFFIWEELYDFYFMRHEGEDVLHISTEAYFPGELIITLGDVSPKQVKSVLLQYLPFREYVKPAFIQRAGEWLEHNFPLERRPA